MMNCNRCGHDVYNPPPKELDPMVTCGDCGTSWDGSLVDVCPQCQDIGQAYERGERWVVDAATSTQAET